MVGLASVGLRPEEAGLRRGPYGRGGPRGRLGCCGLCGSTRPSDRLRGGSPRTVCADQQWFAPTNQELGPLEAAEGLGAGFEG